MGFQKSALVMVTPDTLAMPSFTPGNSDRRPSTISAQCTSVLRVWRDEGSDRVRQQARNHHI